MNQQRCEDIVGSAAGFIRAQPSQEDTSHYSASVFTPICTIVLPRETGESACMGVCWGVSECKLNPPFVSHSGTNAATKSEEFRLKCK